MANCRSVRNKTSSILDYVTQDCKPDIFAITETWLEKRDDAVRVELCPDGYKLLDHPRGNRRGGGTALLYKEFLCVKKVDAGSKSSYEFSEFVISSSSAHKLRLVIIYRPPYSSEHKVSSSVFFTEFSNYMESLLLCKEPLVICGDFNIHVDLKMTLTRSLFVTYSCLLVCVSMSINLHILVGIFLISFQILLSITSLMLITLYLTTPV